MSGEAGLARAVQSERPREEFTRHLKAVECHQRSDRLTFVFEKDGVRRELGKGQS